LVVVAVLLIELLELKSVLEPLVEPVAEPDAPMVVPLPVVEPVVPAVVSVDGVVGAVLGVVLAVLEDDEVSVLLVVGAGVVVEVVEVSVLVSRWQADSDSAAMRARAAHCARGFVVIRTLLERL
jgi:hypothetical protein